MKLRFGHMECDFAREDAEIAVPLILLVLALWLVPLPKTWLLLGFGGYYLLYFFVPPLFVGLKTGATSLRNRHNYHCPYCRSRDTIFQGLADYHGDVPYSFYLCNRCGETAVELRDHLVKVVNKPGLEAPAK